MSKCMVDGCDEPTTTKYEIKCSTHEGTIMQNGFRKSMTTEPRTDDVNHPAHYTSGGIECIDAIEAALTPEEFRGFCKGNIMKYTWREKHKAGVQSLEKVRWYTDRLINFLKREK